MIIDYLLYAISVLLYFNLSYLLADYIYKTYENRRDVRKELLFILWPFTTLFTTLSNESDFFVEDMGKKVYIAWMTVAGNLIKIPLNLALILIIIVFCLCILCIALAIQIIYTVIALISKWSTWPIRQLLNKNCLNDVKPFKLFW